MEKYILKRKIQKFLWRLPFMLLAVFFLVQLSSCYPTLGYPIRLVMRPINQSLYGKKVNVDQSVLVESYIPYNDPKPNEFVEWNGYRLRKTFVVRYKGTGRVVWLDSNNALLKAWYLSSGNKDASYLYKSVAPFDLSLVFGRTATKENLKYLEFSHQENFLTSRRIDPRGYFDIKEITNIHVIPASETIKRVVGQLQWNDIVTIEGYLTDWSGTGELSWVKFETSRAAGDTGTQRIGGKQSFLCKQLYLTKIIFNGYEYQ